MPNITRLTVFRWRFVLPRSRSLSEGTRSYGRLVTIYQSALLFFRCLKLKKETLLPSETSLIMYKSKPNNAVEDLESARLILRSVQYESFRFLWPCIVSKFWSEIENQQDATVRCLLSTLSQHVSGIIMPIFRRTRRVLLHVLFSWRWA